MDFADRRKEVVEKDVVQFIYLSTYLLICSLISTEYPKLLIVIFATTLSYPPSRRVFGA